MKKYFKLIRGYGAEDYIQIEENELEKAYAAFLLKKDAVYSGGAVRGSEIMAIQPDYHRAMGWNRGYRLLADDYEELSNRGVDRAHTHLLEMVKDHVSHLIETNQAHLIGKVEMKPQVTSPKIAELSAEIKSLADSKRV